MADELSRWAASRSAELIARAEAEAVAELKRALLQAAGAAGTAPRAEPAPPAPPTATTATGDALWAYGVMRAEDPEPDPLPGVDDAQAVERIRHGELALLVSRVPLAEFGEEPLRRNLNDLAWLERVARAHEAVLEHALRGGTVVPLRLCTIFDDERGAQEMLDERRPALEAALELLEGRDEWAVKLLLDRAALEARAAPDPDADVGTPGSGAAYMLQRRQERQAREAADRLATELADDVHARLQDWATAARLNPPQNRDLSGHEGDMVLNGAYLVERAKTERLHELVAELREQHRDLGARLEVSGPLPPYNFIPPA